MDLGPFVCMTLSEAAPPTFWDRRLLESDVRSPQLIWNVMDRCAMKAEVRSLCTFCCNLISTFTPGRVVHSLKGGGCSAHLSVIHIELAIMSLLPVPTLCLVLTRLLNNPNASVLTSLNVV
jgi:hypothetical protein